MPKSFSTAPLDKHPKAAGALRVKDRPARLTLAEKAADFEEGNS